MKLIPQTRSKIYKLDFQATEATKDTEVRPGLYDGPDTPRD